MIGLKKVLCLLARILPCLVFASSSEWLIALFTFALIGFTIHDAQLKTTLRKTPATVVKRSLEI